MKQSTLESLSHVCAALVGVAEAVRADTAEALATRDHIAIIKHYNHVRLAVEQIKEVQKALDGMKENLSRDSVPTIMREHNVRTITVEGVGRVSLTNRWSCSMPDKLVGMEWLRDHGHGGLIQETVNSQTLAAFAKDMSETMGVDLPPEIFKTSIMTYTSVTKVGVSNGK